MPERCDALPSSPDGSLILCARESSAVPSGLVFSSLTYPGLSSGAAFFRRSGGCNREDAVVVNSRI